MSVQPADSATYFRYDLAFDFGLILHLIFGGAALPALHLILGGAALPALHLILGGAAVYRCDSCTILTAALAAEVTHP
ncbi:MAG: hypothetical protein ABSA27_08360 [Terriglobales bacterium]|jgi:hypothetical protein